ncbi:RNA-directed RNA polymerase L [Talaromyces islandicus]|uniref:RNA-directed RNA polymerase L n=1 Tax=Talaromyces islandicus TaxID=28573 RepID=A0A0U1LTD4_TALIS|nr:RNA-directed RNA polymerase L [Talaromyces islandicus]
MNGVHTAQQLREKGNALYKKGKLTEAIKTYQDAARHAGNDDCLPWSNLSAAYFETGQYEQAATSALRALALCSRSDNNRREAASLEKKLPPRVFRAYLHTHQYAMARQWLKRYETAAAPDELHQYRSSLDRAEAVWKATPDEKRFRRDLEAEAPRYRPQYDVHYEFYNVGHDEITDILDFSVLSDLKRDISVFFAGVGDARHFYGQLVTLDMTSERMATSSPVKRQYHFSMNDRKASTFARNIVLFALLDELAISKDMPQAQRTELYTVVYFLYLGAIIPHFVVARLDGVIDMIIERLENSDSGTATVVLPWVQVYPSDRPEIVRALKSWKSDGSLTPQFSAARTIELAVMGLRMHRAMISENRAPPGCQKEMDTFSEVPFLQPPRSMLKEHEPELLKLLDGAASVQKLKSYLTANWTTNPTLLDEDWHGKVGCEVYTGWDPFAAYQHFHQILSLQEKGGPQKTKLFDHVSSFFRMVVVALRRIRGRLTAEFLLGDAASVIDAVRHGLIENRDATAPAAFDMVHLSNVPDYIGGSFFTFTTAGKILKNSQAAKLNTTCLRNTSLWKSQEEFHCEYMAVSDTKMLSRVTELQQTGKEGDYPLAMTGYMEWRRRRLVAPAFQYEDLLPRADLTRFLYIHFFKLALPYGRSLSDNDMRNYVQPSLNLTCFFRLLIHLHELGYPAHWLADVLSNILDNHVVTTARPPRSHPLRLQELSDHSNSPAEVCVGPFVSEMSTLTVLFQRILPFTPVSNALPSVDMIHQYSMQLNWLELPKNNETASMVLFFFDLEIHSPGNRIRDELDSSSSASGSNTLKQFRENGCVVITSFVCTGRRNIRTVKFWMREDVMDRIHQQHQHWTCAVWRADDWQRLTTFPEDVSLLVKGRKWADGKYDDIEMDM